MSGRIPLRIEATIDALTDTVAAHHWAWAGDTALAAHGLLRWRDHRDVVTLTSPADHFDPDALIWALGHRAPPPTMQRYHSHVVVPAGSRDQRHAVVLRSYPTPATGTRWDQLTCLAHPHHASPPQRTTSPELTATDVIDRWTGSQFELGASIDALTLSESLGPEPFLARCDHLPSAVLERARTSLAHLAAAPDPRLGVLLAPHDQAAVRLSASRLEQSLRSRGRHR